MTRFIAIFALASASALRAGDEEVTARPDEFPPAGTSQYYSGELTLFDHINRMGVLRADRTDDQVKYHQDLPHHFEMLPYGTLWHCGAPAELHQRPIGTHLHGWFHLGPKGLYEVDLLPTNYEAGRKGLPNRFTPHSPFDRCLRLEDDFTFYQRQGVGWKITSIDREAEKIVAQRVPLEYEAPLLPPLHGYPPVEGLTGEQTFSFTSGTRVWKRNQFGTLTDLQQDDVVLFNLTWATIFGPGQMTDIWIDPGARSFATDRQQRDFLAWVHPRGLPFRVDHVEHSGNGGEGIVTATLYAGVTPGLRNLFRPDTSCSVMVAEPSLRSYDQGNDRKSSRVLAVIDQENPPPGSSGLQVKMRVYELLEGIRPGRTVRILPPNWPQTNVPREESLWPADIRPRYLGVDVEKEDHPEH